MGYKILGYVVWNGGKLYLRGRSGALASRKAAALGVVGVAIVALAVGGKRSSS
ncbi:MAG TPA: hypothetical protein VK501_00950 [Baekduia sp.]|uniref:hypothetical protein n=1 Tax=Baekduia sp. TaxID=2600305 RepID=UPI002C757539|nr:hypothetical protein [Baekduia sp.]HMJ32454.1 hypothetical protein [Baekduia sp.]